MRLSLKDFNDTSDTELDDKIDSNNLAKNTTLDFDVISAFKPLIPFLKKNCTMCHSEFQKNSAEEILTDMRNGMLNFKSPTESPFYLKLKAKQMPPEEIKTILNITDKEYNEFLILVDKFISSIFVN